MAQKQLITSQTKNLESPDGMLVAVVSSSKVLEATIESRIEIRISNGKNLLKRDYSSSDGEHGFGVKKALWTPDSQFFLAGLYCSRPCGDTPIGLCVQEKAEPIAGPG